ncbi:hypothetical protein ACRALDRAFT_2014837 [Sodiomyces alcalophilus JCM 7366]|uniref:uncharacterized protein n=1 Tax=Sodiomyces alcalophilus JCM 7366 TaxID=591952 RepID=UPI0039B53506
MRQRGSKDVGLRGKGEVGVRSSKMALVGPEPNVRWALRNVYKDVRAGLQAGRRNHNGDLISVRLMNQAPETHFIRGARRQYKKRVCCCLQRSVFSGGALDQRATHESPALAQSSHGDVSGIEDGYVGRVIFESQILNPWQHGNWDRLGRK